MLERAVHSQLYEYLEESKLISDFQFGFRKGKSTKHDSGNLVGCCFIDLCKAFDTNLS